MAAPPPHRRIDELRNLGPVTARQLAECGIASESDLRAVGAVAAYRMLKFRFPRETSLNALWALHGALHDVPWDRLAPETKAELRRLAGAEPDRP